MKIQNTSSSNLAGVGNTSALSSAGGSGRHPTPSPAQGDQSALSSLSRALESASSDQTSKVVQLSQIVSSGRYQVNPQQLSNSLIEAHLRAAA
ncbi:MAG: flagellar biosynthesis anti-sigma factor FlgM [Bryobacteraceae bacterium]|jgi:anti-sigma28 factor (negative regulator of flagellin synthesis)